MPVITGVITPLTVITPLRWRDGPLLDVITGVITLHRRDHANWPCIIWFLDKPETLGSYFFFELKSRIIALTFVRTQL